MGKHPKEGAGGAARFLLAVTLACGTAILTGPLVLASAAGASTPTCTGTVSGTTAGTCSTSGQLDVAAGPLEFTVTGNTTTAPCASGAVCVGFNGVTLNGFDQETSANVDASANLQVVDATGSGNGWNFGIGASQFLDSNGSIATLCAAPGANPATTGDEACLPTTIQYENDTTYASTSGAVPTFACATNSTCTAPNNSLTTYPVSITTGAVGTVGTITSVFNAATDTGMGAISVSGDYLWQSVPANTYAGQYTNTIEFALASGPSGTP